MILIIIRRRRRRRRHIWFEHRTWILFHRSCQQTIYSQSSPKTDEISRKMSFLPVESGNTQLPGFRGPPPRKTTVAEQTTVSSSIISFHHHHSSSDLTQSRAPFIICLLQSNIWHQVFYATFITLLLLNVFEDGETEKLGRCFAMLPLVAYCNARPARRLPWRLAC